MQVEVVTIGDELLFNEIIDTNAPYIIRCLREINLDPFCKLTVGDKLDAIVQVFQAGLKRSHIVVTTGGMGANEDDFTYQAIVTVTGRNHETFPHLTYLNGLSPTSYGMMVEQNEGTLICLPGNPRDMTYIMESVVLPYLQNRLQQERPCGWLLLRTAGAMESTLRQLLGDLELVSGQRITFISFAGQTDIRLWVEANSQDEVGLALNRLRGDILERLGDHIYGEEQDRLEQIVLGQLQNADQKLVIAECDTGRVLSRSLGSINNSEALTLTTPANVAELSDYLGLVQPTAEGDLTKWCRLAADLLMRRHQSNLALLLFNNITPGGVQILVTLASRFGVSMIQRSFGGHPDNINYWANTLALVHLRRWLLAHFPDSFG